MNEKDKKIVEIYTDGACSGNPGPGGWAAVLKYKGNRKEISGGIKATTNNRMELQAAIEGLAALKESCQVNLYSDSAYLINAFKQGWLDNWQRNGWKNAKKQPVENQDLWQQLLSLNRKHQISWHKVKGHSDDEENNRCDALAKAALEKYLN
ncbi:MAG: ribonuclease HI [Firmicutes bacterium]|jgi:ribonuclease HI|nr:ribonuclease HI [Bacillota bacterium]